MPQTILIPGLLCDETVWQPLIERLTVPAIVANVPDTNSLTEMAKGILAEHSGELSVLGHSMGARIALEMVRLQPERISRLGLFDTGIHPLREGERAKRVEIVEFAYSEGMEALADRWLAGMVHPAKLDSPDIMEPLKQMVIRKSPALHARQIEALVSRPDASAGLGDIRCPVLLLVGREDQWSPVSQHQDMLRLLPNAKLEIIPFAGHFSIFEQPQEVSLRVNRFLSG